MAVLLHIYYWWMVPSQQLFGIDSNTCSYKSYSLISRYSFFYSSRVYSFYLKWHPNEAMPHQWKTSKTKIVKHSTNHNLYSANVKPPCLLYFFLLHILRLHNFLHHNKMGSLERSKKRALLWKKALIHFSLCFVMGFFTGIAPTGKPSTYNNYSTQVTASNTSNFTPQHQTTNVNENSMITKTTQPEAELKPRRLVIIVTPTTTKHEFQAVFLRKMANTLKLVPQPLLWIVVEAQTESKTLPEILRKTGIMYRHLVFKENFTDLEAEMNHQRNLALKHIEHHRLNGIVHFAGLSNVYDLQFFHHLRDIEYANLSFYVFEIHSWVCEYISLILVLCFIWEMSRMFGAWPMAMLKAHRKKVKIEGPVCDSSQVIGWHIRNKNNNEKSAISPPIHISGFAFNSSILWDPERWGRTSSVQDTSQVHT